MDGTPSDTKQKLQEALDQFLKVAEEAKRQHAETIGAIMRDINDMRIKEIREKLGLK